MKNLSNHGELEIPPLQVIYSGRVQGVGFRWTCRSIAKHHAVVGTVRNLVDGTVELFADGESQAVADLLDEIASAMAHNIQSIEAKAVTAEVPFEGFRILG